MHFTYASVYEIEDDSYIGGELTIRKITNENIIQQISYGFVESIKMMNYWKYERRYWNEIMNR